MKRFIVVTTIQSPTNALVELAQLKDWQLVVVGDKKTPAGWHIPGAVFLSVESQLNAGFRLAEQLPFGHYSRKNIGYLYAFAHGAEVIFETDDDNALIKPSLPVEPYEVDARVLSSTDAWVNIYSFYTDQKVWPRGFPLSKLHASPPAYEGKSRVKVPVQQSLVNKDPDVDAVYRLTYGQEVSFESREPCALAKRSYCPFNSQATIWRKEAFWTMLLPISVSMRATDIWRGLLAQSLLWHYGETILFRAPFMVQIRNQHDLLNDFREEISLYLDVDRFVEVIESLREERPLRRLVEAYESLATSGIFDTTDVRAAEAWCSDIRDFASLKN